MDGLRLEDWQRTVPIDQMATLVETPTSYYGDDPPMAQTPGDPFFGTVANTLRDNLVAGGSELGMGMMLFALAVSIRAKTILEVGRHRGFSTFAFASALRFIEQGWAEHPNSCQRPDVDYPKHEAREAGDLFSIDVLPNPAAKALIDAHGLSKYVHYIDLDSKTCVPTDMYDIMLIDGDHSFQGCLADVQNFVPKWLRPGGYFILHDWFGWYDTMGNNNSPIKLVGDFVGADMERLLIDTGCQSFKIFRKQSIPFPSPQVMNVLPSADESLDLNTGNGILAGLTTSQLV